MHQKIYRMAAAVLAVFAYAGCAGAEEAVINVNDYGAIADDGQDDTAAVHKALEKCKQIPGCTLIFPKGTYDFMEASGPTYNPEHWALPLIGFKGITVDGLGSTLNFHGLQYPMRCHRSEDVTIRNMVIDYPRPPFTPGWVVAADEKGNYFDVQAEADYPVKGGEVVEAFRQMDPMTGLGVYRGLDVYHRVARTELVGPQLLRVHLTVPIPLVKKGMYMVLRHKLYSHSLFLCENSRNLTFEDIQAYAGPGMGITGRRADTMTLRRLQFIRKPGSGRLMSIASDATHFQECKNSITIEDSVFDGMGDDAVNIYPSLYWTIRKVVDANTVEVFYERNGVKWIPWGEAGDTMEAVNADTLLPLGKNTIRRVTPNPETSTAIFEFTAPLPAGLRPNVDLLSNRTDPAKIRISNCSFRNIRGRGVLIQTSDALVENSKFENITCSGVHVSAVLDHWYEGARTERVTIRNNTFTNCSYSGTADSTASAVIHVYAFLRGKKMAEAGVHSNLLIENNTLQTAAGGGIFLNAVDGGIIRNNHMIDLSLAPNLTWGENAVTLQKTKNICIEGNDYQVTSPFLRRLSGSMLLGDGCDEATLQIRNNSNFYYAKLLSEQEMKKLAAPR